jgi:hypothetical protein
MRLVRGFLFSFLLMASSGLGYAESLGDFSKEFWQWRAAEQPFTNDDIPRIDRPVGFAVDWTPKTIAQREKDLLEFEGRWNGLAPAASAPVAEQVDYRLLGSAIARVRWELVIEKNWQRDPEFYVDQTLGSVYVLMLPPPPFSEARQREIVERLKRIPADDCVGAGESDGYAAAVCAVGDRVA